MAKLLTLIYFFFLAMGFFLKIPLPFYALLTIALGIGTFVLDYRYRVKNQHSFSKNHFVASGLTVFLTAIFLGILQEAGNMKDATLHGEGIFFFLYLLVGVLLLNHFLVSMDTLQKKRESLPYERRKER